MCNLGNKSVCQHRKRSWQVEENGRVKNGFQTCFLSSHLLSALKYRQVWGFCPLLMHYLMFYLLLCSNSHKLTGVCDYFMLRVLLEFFLCFCWHMDCMWESGNFVPIVAKHLMHDVTFLKLFSGDLIFVLDFFFFNSVSTVTHTYSFLWFCYVFLC